MIKVRIYDNGGKTLDCYTVIFDDTNECFSISSNPTHPCGVAMWNPNYSPSFNETQDEKTYGKRISLEELPKEAREWVKEKIKQKQLEQVFEVLAQTGYVNPAEFADENHIEMDYARGEIIIEDYITHEKFTLIVK